MSYSQLTQEQRYQIDALMKMEHSKHEIATMLGWTAQPSIAN